jgi:hypothetical protein
MSIDKYIFQLLPVATPGSLEGRLHKSGKRLISKNGMVYYEYYQNMFRGILI